MFHCNFANDRFEKHMDILFMITHNANFNTAIQALILIHQVATAKQIVLDRYYRTLYESLLDRRLTTSSKQALYLNLLFKSLKSDNNTSRVKAFIKRLVQITSMHSPGFICGALFLLSELLASRLDLKSLLSSTSTISEYDAHKRDPLYANAENSSLWELSPLLQHYHPTVQLYAQNLVTPQHATKPDLALHTTKHFLDRFVYRNPKTKVTVRGSSLMQPLPGLDTNLILRIKGSALSERAVNSEDWWRQQSAKIRPDEVFFHRYFVAKEEKEVKVAGKKRKRDDEDMDEDEVWEAIVKSSKEEGGDDVDFDGSDGEVDWSDEEELDEEAFAEMNEGVSEDEIGGFEEEISDEEGAVGDFFDDEAEVDGEEEEDEEEEEKDESAGDDEEEEVEDTMEMSGEDEESDASGDRFEFGDDESDIMASDEEVDVPIKEVKSDRSKKRKLKSLPTFASAEDYAHMLED
jgi:ribosome biogenesis protein MAK21